jgi:hypothetical protein
MQGSDPLALLTLIEKTVLSQNEEHTAAMFGTT